MADQNVPEMRPIVTRQEALAQGLPFYFTGKPCKHGHISERRTKRIVCVTCDALVYRPSREIAAERSKKRYEANREARIAYRKAYDAANADKKREAARLYRQRKPDLHRAMGAAKRARKRAAGGRYTAAEVRALFKAQRGKCAYCRTSIKAGFHADHIQPLAKGGTNWIRNIQLLCQPCNQAKHVKHPIDFAQERGLLL